MYCKHCGKEIADDSKFCQHCGKAQNGKIAYFKGILDKKTLIELVAIVIVAVSFFIAVDSNLRSDIAKILRITDNSQVEDSLSIESNYPHTNINVKNETVACMKVKAEVFRLVGDYYKDTFRKEEILIDVDSNGTYHFSAVLDGGFDFSRFTYTTAAQISPINGYEYEIWCVEKSGVKIVYAFNSDEMKEIK